MRLIYQPEQIIKCRCLRRDGKCSCCGAVVRRDEMPVIAFWGKKELVVICEDCFMVAEGMFNER